MIHAHEVLGLIIDTYPKARNYFVSKAEDWVPKHRDSGYISTHRLLSILTDLVVDQFVQTEYDHCVELFELIEQFVSEGDEGVSNAACTCFIENLQNIASHDDNEFEYSHFVSLLGPESRAYAKAWDEFTGIRTDGLD